MAERKPKRKARAAKESNEYVFEVSSGIFATLRQLADESRGRITWQLEREYEEDGQLWHEVFVRCERPEYIGWLKHMLAEQDNKALDILQCYELDAVAR